MSNTDDRLTEIAKELELIYSFGGLGRLAAYHMPWLISELRAARMMIQKAEEFVIAYEKGCFPCYIAAEHDHIVKVLDLYKKEHP